MKNSPPLGRTKDTIFVCEVCDIYLDDKDIAFVHRNCQDKKIETDTKYQALRENIIMKIADYEENWDKEDEHVKIFIKDLKCLIYLS